MAGPDLTERSVIEAHGFGLTFSASAGGATQSEVLSTEVFGRAMDVELGRRADCGAFPMEGVLFDVIATSPGIAVNDRAAIRDYAEGEVGSRVDPRRT